MKSDGFHHGNLRAALISGGLEVLEAGGEPSLRDLARRAGVTPMAVYRHFADKESLLLALADAGFAALAERTAEAGHGAPPEARLLAVCRAYVAFAAAQPALFRLMFAEPIDMARISGAGSASAAAYAVLSDAVAAALGPEADEAALTVGLAQVWSAVHGFAGLSLANRLPRALSTGDQHDRIMAPLIRSLFPRTTSLRGDAEARD